MKLLETEKTLRVGRIVNFFDGAQIKNLVINGSINEQSPREHSAASERIVYSDEQIARALANINGKGKAIDTKWKWAGGLWLLHFRCGFPLKAQEFCERVGQLPLPDDLEFKCEYNNIRPYSTLSFIGEDVRYPDKVKYSTNDRTAYLQLRSVAEALDRELERVRESDDPDMPIG